MTFVTTYLKEQRMLEEALRYCQDDKNLLHRSVNSLAENSLCVSFMFRFFARMSHISVQAKTVSVLTSILSGSVFDGRPQWTSWTLLRI